MHAKERVFRIVNSTNSCSWMKSSASKIQKQLISFMLWFMIIDYNLLSDRWASRGNIKLSKFGTSNGTSFGMSTKMEVANPNSERNQRQLYKNL